MQHRRPVAEIVHRMPERARLRLALGDEELALLEHIGRGLAAHESVTGIKLSARTGSILILFRGELEPILEQAQARGLFELKPPRTTRKPMRQLRLGIEQVDAVMADGTRGAMSLGNMTFLGLVAFGLFQAQRGHILPPTITLFHYAMGVMNWVADHERR
jgi:hypothetical protein